MVLTITDISFDDFIKLDSQKDYAYYSNFCCIFKDLDKKAILNRYIYLLYLYPTFSKDDLYLTLMTNSYYDSLNTDLPRVIGSELINCPIIPDSLEEEYNNPEMYHRYTDKIFNNADVDRTLNILEKSKLTNKNPMTTIKITHEEVFI